MAVLKSVGEINLNVVDQGPAEPVLFVHGFPLDLTMWKHQLFDLFKMYRCICPDLRGFGKSDVTEGTVTMEQHADDLARLLESMEVTRPVSVCGLSMGGYVAFQFWKRHRDKLAKLVLCDTRAVADSAEAKQGRYQSAERVLREGSEFLAQDMPSKLFSKKTFQEQPKLVEETQAVIRRNPASGIAAALRGMAERPDVTSWLGEIDVPTLLIVGEEDQISKADEMRGIAEKIPGAQFEVISQAGHMAPLEEPQQVNKILRKFLWL